MATTEHATWNAPKVKTVPDTLNKALAPAYSETPEFQMAAILLSSFGTEDSYYESGSEKIERLKNLLVDLSPEFVAKAAIFARRTMNMRALPNLVAASALLSPTNLPWKRNFFAHYPVRADDPLEIMGAAEYLMGHQLDHCPKFLQTLWKKGKKGVRREQGFGKYLSTLDKYKLAKYSVNVSHKMKGRAWKLIDLVNLCHPLPTEALNALVKGTLEKADTHESSVSAKVNAALEEMEEGADREAIKAEVRKEDWERLLLEKKLGYMALLKNCRNMLANRISEPARTALFEQLTNSARADFRKIIPFRFLSAYKAIGQMHGQVDGINEALVALSKAVALSLANVPTLPGKTVTLVDESGSMMTTPINQRKNDMEEWQIILAGEIAMLFAATLSAKGSDTVLFSDNARYVRINPANSLFSAVDLLSRRPAGTNIVSALEVLHNAYDRIIILSDGQHWLGGSCDEALERYCRRTGANPMIFSWNLVPYGTQPMALGKLRLMAGWSDRALDQIRWGSEDPNGLLNYIKAIDLDAPYPKD